MKRIVVHMEFEVPDHVTENMVALKFENIESEMYDHLEDELEPDEECYMSVFDCYE